jgi:hypothetical protein
MKIVFRTVLFHITCIIIFAFVYMNMDKHFLPLNHEIHDYNISNKFRNFLDFLMMSSSIQTGIGFTNLYPASSLCKIIIIIQEIIMVSTHLFTLYIFTL